MNIEMAEVMGEKLVVTPGKRLQLTKAQAGPRLHNLLHIDGNIYEVVSPIEFKRGEIIGVVSTELPKADLPKVKLPEKKKKAKETPSLTEPPKNQEPDQDQDQAPDAEEKRIINPIA